MLEPLRYGTHGHDRTDLLMNYYVTQDNLLVPDPVHFFSDRFASHAGFLIQHGISGRYGKSALRGATAVLDELLTILTPERAIHPLPSAKDLHGVFPPDTSEFFHADLLCGLREDIAGHGAFEAQWIPAKDAYLGFSESLWDGKKEIIPRGIEALGLRYIHS